ncbi:MAG: rRNA maturation RNase YbeY [Ferruginibacter sp.]
MVKFSFQSAFSLKDRKKLKTFLCDLILNEGYKVGLVEIIFCSDEFLLEINRDFLKHDYYTDIITFGEATKDNTISGELYISIDRVAENSKLYNKSINEELHRVIFHGLLHLCGYRDKSNTEILTMRNKEEEYLSKYL